MKYFFLIIMLTSIVKSAPAQTNFDCSIFLKQEINTESPEVFINEAKKLENCGLDSIDTELFFQAPFMGTFFVEQKKNKSTYGDLLNTFNDYKKDSKYLEARNILIESKKLKYKKARIENWDEDKKALQRMGASEEQINDLYNFLLHNKDKDWTYEELGKEYKSEKSKINSEKQEDAFSESLHNYKYIVDAASLEKVERLLMITDYEKGQQVAQKLNKPALIYFNGYSCVNARKFEEKILTDDNVNNFLINNFVIINLYVDDNTALPQSKQYKSKYRDKMITTVGQKNSDIQSGSFNVYTQPYLVVINKKREKINDIGYISNPKLFLDFLKDTLAKWNE